MNLVGYFLLIEEGWAQWYIHTWNSIALIAICVGLVIIIYQSVFAFIDPRKRMKKKTQNDKDTCQETKLSCVDKNKINHYGILIPARNESRVISNLLDSITSQTYKILPQDIYVIVESADDPTVEICKKRNVSVFIRTNLENRHKKGYALDECLKDIFEKKLHYDAFFIFDADNILSPTYIENMNQSFNDGYDMAMGYRNNLNWNSSVRAACSALTFTMINCFSNKRRAKKNLNIIVSGTGFYIRGSILESLNGYPFFTLTEDYELSMYAVVNGFKTTYNELAEYYDEQPDKSSQSWNQRERWVRGFVQVRKIYQPKLDKIAKEKTKVGASCKDHKGGVTGYIVLIAIAVVYFLAMVVGSIVLGLRHDQGYVLCLNLVWAFIAVIYLLLFLFSILMLSLERRRNKMNFWIKVGVIFYNPIFLFLWLPIAICAICKKEVKWVAVEHKGPSEKQ